MDLLKVLLLYMTMVVSASTEAAPAITPPPAAALPTATPYVTLAPTALPTAVPTPVPTATPVPYTTLYVGDRGESVKKLQRRLKELGYLTGTIDGVFGQQTKKAVERFQYYNNLKVDGIAGKATQSLLFENPSVVTAPPEITPGPTATTPVSVSVPVYYVDQNGTLLTRVLMTCYGTTTIYANGNNVSSDYVLDSSGAVTVTVNNGVANPASVTFRYKQKTTPVPTASTITVPVYYVTTDGTILHQTSATVSRGYTSYVIFAPSLVSNAYELVGDDRQAVAVDQNGTANPASVVFTLRLRATQAPTASPTPAPSHQEVTIYYVNELGSTLNQETRLLPRGQISYVSPNAALAPWGYTLVSPDTLTVNITQDGVQRPDRIVFLYSIVPTTAPSAIPTEVPAPVPTEVPTPIPTEAPTPVPTEEPTPVPTEVPTPVPTEEPTPVPTEVPAPTQGLTQAGSTVTLNGSEASLIWYTDESNQVMLNLEQLAAAAGWNYTPNAGTPVIVCGCELLTSYGADSIYILTVNRENQYENGRIWNGELYVNLAFLQALGAQTAHDGNALSLVFPQ